MKSTGTMRFPFIPLFVLALPFLEIAGFIVVGRQIGVLATLALLIAAAMLGVLLLRIQGFGAITRIRKELEAGRDPSGEVAKGVMISVAGILLLIPGFVTDIIGLLLFLPAVRSLAWHFIKSRVAVATTGLAGFVRPDRARGRTIDLDTDEYTHETESPQTDSPWRRIDRD